MNKKKKVTLKGMAHRLGVSTATVSKALRGSSDISRDMQKRVKKLATELGYRPNLMARTLIYRRSYLLGAIIPDLRISFFSEVTRGIYEQARLRGYVAILMVNDEKPENERRNLEFLSDLHVDGILLNPAPGKLNFDMYKRLVEEGFPIVCYDRKLDEFGFSSVTIDDRQAAFRLTSELIKRGRRNILFLGPKSGISVAEERYQGYLDALNDSNIPFNPELVVHSELYAEDSYRVMEGVLTNGLKPDAVLCVGGLVAYGAGKAILEFGLSIPGDIILAEFGDNDIIARLGVPFLTINQNPYKIGQLAVDLLVDEIENEPSPAKHIIVDTKLLYHELGHTKVELA
ncbi:MAG: LacI family transcriptional regulator [candidate division KSB1 bacterium]|nr:LacI family transcriptional regulator [candidate division KSB1 bacterium]